MFLKDRLQKINSFHKDGKIVRYTVSFKTLFKPRDEKSPGKYIIACVISTNKHTHHFVSSIEYYNVEEADKMVMQFNSLYKGNPDSKKERLRPEKTLEKFLDWELKEVL